MIGRDYDPERDRHAACRIWREVGWLEDGQDDWLDDYAACGRALVGDLDGQAECMVLTVPGDMRYLRADVPASCVTGVTTSRVARRRGLATRLTAEAVAADVAEGARVAALGMFDQGFYNRLGFGTGGYEHEVSFDPATLAVQGEARTPRRILPGDWEAVHAARLARWRRHGNLNVHPGGITRGEMREEKDVFGLGYFDGPNGALSHYLWCRCKGDENGPYSVKWLAYRTPDQFRELMALLRSLGDQVCSVRMQEPPGLQFQDLLRQPFRMQSLTGGSKHEGFIRARAFWQVRICDVPACIGYTRLAGPSVRFNLRLADPIGALLPDGPGWRGVGGDYVVTLGPAPGAEPGHADGLPTMACSVSAFTRLWLGVLPATSLAMSDELEAPPELLEALDETVRLPRPQQDWDF